MAVDSYYAFKNGFSDPDITPMLRETLLGVTKDSNYVDSVFSMVNSDDFSIDSLKELTTQYPFDYVKSFHTKRIDSIIRPVQEINPTSYFDFGCNDSSITNYITDKLNIHKDSAFGIDVKPISNVTSFTPLTYTGKEIPLPDNSVDFISVMMVMHHVKDRDFYISELYRILSQHGVLFLRETDTRNEYNYSLFNCIMEVFYYTVFPNKDVQVENDLYHASSDYWKLVFQNNGFTPISDFQVEPWNHFTPHHFYFTKLSLHQHSLISIL
jgi:SAM-dependent methyltransferase